MMFVAINCENVKTSMEYYEQLGFVEQVCVWFKCFFPIEWYDRSPGNIFLNTFFLALPFRTTVEWNWPFRVTTTQRICVCGAVSQLLRNPASQKQEKEGYHQPSIWLSPCCVQPVGWSGGGRWVGLGGPFQCQIEFWVGGFIWIHREEHSISFPIPNNKVEVQASVIPTPVKWRQNKSLTRRQLKRNGGRILPHHNLISYWEFRIYWCFSKYS